MPTLRLLLLIIVVGIFLVGSLQNPAGARSSVWLFHTKQHDRFGNQTSRGTVTSPATGKNEYVVRGTLHDSTSSRSMKGLLVKVFDGDCRSGRLLGMASSRKGGHFEIEFAHSSAAVEASFCVFNEKGLLLKSMEIPEPFKAGANINIDINLGRFDPDAGETSLFSDSQRITKGLADKLSNRELIEVLWFVRYRLPFSRLNAAQKALARVLKPPGLSDDCGERALTLLDLLLKEREDNYSSLCVLPPGATKRYFYTDHVVVTYTTCPLYPREVVKDPKPPKVDDPYDSPDGRIGMVRADKSALHELNKDVPPTYVQQVGLLAEYAWHRYVNELGFKDPRGGDSRVKITICFTDYTGATTPNKDYIEISPRNSLFQNLATVPHELFHRVQYQYNNTSDQSGLYGVMREGGARFIEDSLVDKFNRYVFESQKIFENPSASLVNPKPDENTTIAYAAALLWKYLAEQHSLHVTSSHEPNIGIDVYRQLLETMATPLGGSTPPYEPAALRTACKLMPRPGNFDEFEYLDPAHTELISNETSWGNYLLANHLHGTTAAPSGDGRFKYKEDIDSVLWEEQPYVSRLAAVRALIRPDDDVTIGTAESVLRLVEDQSAYAARYYRITPSTAAPPRSLRISLNAFGGMSDPLIQILSFGPGEVLTDISKSDQPSYTKTINMTGLSSVVVIVASRMNAGDYTVNFEEVEGGADPMITRWNSATRTEYEVNSRDYPWTQTSPDLIIDNNNDNEPDAALVPGINNSLKIRPHNRGNAQAAGFSVDLYYQTDSSQLDPDRWQPVRNGSNEIQTVSNATLAAAGRLGDSKWFSVNWAPPANISSSKLCVKAIIRFPGDLNADNNTSIGCFSQAGPSLTTATRF
ncbi:MAG TPA: hypothetical protein VF290_17705 [Pyrinomonadaceae bacterium]